MRVNGFDFDIAGPVTGYDGRQWAFIGTQVLPWGDAESGRFEGYLWECTYCGGMNDEYRTSCPTCGGRRDKRG